MNALRSLVRSLLPALDLVLSPITLLAALWMRLVRRAGVQRLPVGRRILRAIGVFPIVDHYYEPYVDLRRLARPLGTPRELPGIDWNVGEQLERLARFHWNDELRAFPLARAGELDYFYDNGMFGAGDAEILYATIRSGKPRRVVEVGCGYSTLIAVAAEKRNAAEDPGAACEHVCIEPYEQPWLERVTGVRVIRSRVERVDRAIFDKLASGDILFIDSSHVLRPQGDVAVELLELLPRLAPGVLVHFHDIFSPREYPESWWVRGWLWNEQYALEAFLSHNRDFRVVAALNLLKHDHFDRLTEKCPVLAAHPAQEPGSFWIVRNDRPGAVH